MSIFGLEDTPIGPVARGFERTTRHGRTFDRWEIHYDATRSGICIVSLVLPVNEIPPEEKTWDGETYYRVKADLEHRIVWYSYKRPRPIYAPA